MKIERVWSEYRNSIKSFLHSKVSNATEVDDLLQEVSIKTYEKLHTIKNEASVKAWLFQIANNTIVDFYRRRARAKDYDPNDLYDLWYSKGDRSIQEELSRCVEPFIRALPEDSAQLLTAIELEGRSQKDYAQALGVNYSTLKSRVQKARMQLRSLFEKCCHFTLDRSGHLVEYKPKSDCYKNC